MDYRVFAFIDIAVNHAESAEMALAAAKKAVSNLIADGKIEDMMNYSFSKDDVMNMQSLPDDPQAAAEYVVKNTPNLFLRKNKNTDNEITN